MKRSASFKEFVSSPDFIVKHMSSLYSERKMSDVCLVVNGREFPSHRLILSMVSDVFHCMLTGKHWNESVAERVELNEPEECLEHFGDFLRFFYTGIITIEMKNVLPLAALADKYMTKSLVNHCMEYMLQHVASAALAGTLPEWIKQTNLAALRHFLSLNVSLCANLDELDMDTLCAMLQDSNLVVRDEMELFGYAKDWLDALSEDIANEHEMKALVIIIMSHIRFPMMTPRDLCGLLMCPLVRKYGDFFLDRMALGIAFHRGCETSRMLEGAGGSLQMTPRLYTADVHSSLISVENVLWLDSYYTRTLVFTSPAGLAEHEKDRLCEWVVDVYPKGVWIRPCYLISYQGQLEVPGCVLQTVRVSITCKDPWSTGFRPVKVGILVYGMQHGIEFVFSVSQCVHKFTDTERVLHINDVVPFEALNPPAALLAKFQHPSPYLVGPHRNVFKIHVIIQPQSDY